MPVRCRAREPRRDDRDRAVVRGVGYSNDDAFDYAPANSRPWHGVQWLENRGGLDFELHRIADLSGASSPQAADPDGDGTVDLVTGGMHIAGPYDRMSRVTLWSNRGPESSP